MEWMPLNLVRTVGYVLKGKFGKPAMPEAETATQYTKNLVDGKIVRVKLLRRDQYNRAVGKVTVRYVAFKRFMFGSRLSEMIVLSLESTGRPHNSSLQNRCLDWIGEKGICVSIYRRWSGI
eukprot:scaffold97855_cov67-Attheya_sp.AAC.1